MNKLQNNFTTPEQSKRLLELGVPVDSADCYWFDEREIFFLKDKSYSGEAKDGELVRATDFTPCWSVGRLIEIYNIITGRKEFTLRTVDTLINEVIYMLNVVIKHEELDFSKLEE